MNPQLKRRFSAPFYLKPFGFENNKEVKDFRGVLKKIHSELPLSCPELHEANIARRFFYASCGLFDYVAKMITDRGAMESWNDKNALRRLLAETQSKLAGSNYHITADSTIFRKAGNFNTSSIQYIATFDPARAKTTFISSSKAVRSQQ